MKSIVVLCVSSLVASVSSACPLVAVPQVSAVAAVGTAQVAVVPQTVAVAVPAVVQQPVQVQTFAFSPLVAQPAGVQVLAAPVCVQSARARSAQRVGILGRVLGGTRSLAISRTVSR